jgi:radical SAM superfamily enzyme YgiQ (UPF0313 family)
MRVLLISTYELGRQPFGLASASAWLRATGARVCSVDLSREAFDEGEARAADLIAFYVPMHTATRLAAQLVPAIREVNPRAHLCFFGLYAPMNETYLRRLGAGTILGGEFEEGLANLARQLEAGGTRKGTQKEPVISLERLKFLTPDRTGMAGLERHARLVMPNGEKRVAGYTEASRGCKHLCRHCPVVPVYNGVFRVVPRDVVLEDIRQQAAVGAQHITFGDPDFFNGIGHAIPLVEALHREFPQLTYDATIKVEHLVEHAEHVRTLRETGCLFVTSAAESVDDAVLEKLEKGHTRSDFLEVVRRFRDEGLVLQPTFVPFTPWTTLEGYGDLLEVLRANGLVENVAPIQLAIRLLIPAGSRLLELREIEDLAGPYDEEALVYPWRHRDARVDALCEQVQQGVHSGEKMGLSRARIFARTEAAALRAMGQEPAAAAAGLPVLASRATIPYLNEPWYC